MFFEKLVKCSEFEAKIVEMCRQWRSVTLTFEFRKFSIQIFTSCELFPYFFLLKVKYKLPHGLKFEKKFEN